MASTTTWCSLSTDHWKLWQRIYTRCVLRDTGCLEWQGARSTKRDTRRPIMRIGKRVVSVARVVCEMYHGSAQGREAGHTCPAGENALCVNPEHLQWMSREENEQYKRARQLASRAMDRRCDLPGVQHRVV